MTDFTMTNEEEAWFIRAMIEGGDVEGSSTLPFAVPLTAYHFGLVAADGPGGAFLYEDTEAAIAKTVTGKHDFWFDPVTAEARISVETDHERVMLALSLEGRS